MNIGTIAFEILKIDAEQRLKWITDIHRRNFGAVDYGSRHVDELFDIALDVLSASKDKICEGPELNFCRDGLRDKWDTLLKENPSDQAIQEFVEMVRREVRAGSSRVPGRHG